MTVFIPEDAPAVVKSMLSAKQNLLNMEAIQINQMGLKWFEVEKALDGKIAGLINEINDLTEKGLTPSRGKVLQLEQYKALIVQARAEFERYSDYAESVIFAAQQEWAKLALNDAAEALRLSFLGNEALGAAFTTLPTNATEFMVGLTSTGQPLGDLLTKRLLDPDTFVNVTDTLMKATALGWNPVKTANLIKNDFAGGFNKALLIARTEQLRVYRESTLMSYRESGIVLGYRRLSAKDNRVCPACLMADGMAFPANTPFAEHPQGRCTPVPIVEGLPPPDWEFGQDWFEKQPPSVQFDILGQGRWQAWKDGQFDLPDIIQINKNDIFGDSLVPKPLKDLVSKDWLDNYLAPKPKPPTIIKKPPPKVDLTPPPKIIKKPPPSKLKDVFEATKPDDKKQANQLLTKWLNSLTPQQQKQAYEALDNYTGGGYSQINKYLRGKLDNPPQWVLEAVDELNKMTSLPLPENMTLYRGTKNDRVFNSIKKGLTKAGSYYDDAGYMSTSVKREQAFGGNIFLEIKVGKNAKGAYINGRGNHPSEDEVLLPAGTKLKILNIRDLSEERGVKYAGKMYIIAELIG
jgi:SPP1 gp7 family putative phage head morphogenesis protein